MPQSWALEIPTNPGECSLIDGVYENIGQGKTEEESLLIEVRFDVALGRPMPSAKTPETIAVAVFDDNTLVFSFGGPLSASISEPYKCVEGWYLIERKRSDIYLGDGANMEYSNWEIALRKSKEEGLIIHSVADEKYSSLAVIESTEFRQIWSLFLRVNQIH